METSLSSESKAANVKANVVEDFVGCGVGADATAARVPPLRGVDVKGWLHVHAKLDLQGCPGVTNDENTP
jgi:hypothetical protein